jgi:hypothetical protein
VGVTDDLAAFPATIELSLAQPPRRYVRRPDLLAVHGELTGGSGAAEGELLAPGITLLPVALLNRVAEGARVTPVYSLGAAGHPLVPTGRVLVRFSEADQAETHRGAIERAGYRLVGPLAYAPHVAWVDSPDDAAHALGGLARLEGLPGVVYVEPEMVGRRASR